MTDSDSTYREEGSDSPTESKPNWRRDLENRAKEAEQQAADYASRLEAYERRDTFRSAGLDLDDVRTQYFVKAYEGEMDASAIHSEAEAAGFISDNAPPIQQSDSIMPDVLQAEERIQSAGEGGDPVAPPDLDARIKATKNPDELRALIEGEGIHWGATA